MIDIHNHILPGIDDGATDMDQAIAMARIAENERITDIIATPHLADPGLTAQEIERRTAILNTELSSRGVSVRVHPGAEIPFFMLEEQNHRIGLAGSRCLLVELPFHLLPSTAAEMFRMVAADGYKVIIAHPERNAAVARDPEKLVALLGPGIMVQVTADSLTGRMGDQARACSRYLVKKNLVDFVASDAHDDTGRPPILSEAVSAIGMGKARDAKRFVLDNPRKHIGLATADPKKPQHQKT